MPQRLPIVVALVLFFASCAPADPPSEESETLRKSLSAEIRQPSASLRTLRAWGALPYGEQPLCTLPTPEDPASMRVPKIHHAGLSARLIAQEERTRARSNSRDADADENCFLQINNFEVYDPDPLLQPYRLGFVSVFVFSRFPQMATALASKACDRLFYRWPPLQWEYPDAFRRSAYSEFTRWLREVVFPAQRIPETFGKEVLERRLQEGSETPTLEGDCSIAGFASSRPMKPGELSFRLNSTPKFLAPGLAEACKRDERVVLFAFAAPAPNELLGTWASALAESYANEPDERTF